MGVCNCSMFCCTLLFEERADGFAYFVFLVSRDDWAALPRGATGLSAVCDCGISWSYSLTFFICSRSRCMDKLRVFHANQTYMCLYPPWNRFKPSSELFLLTFQGGTYSSFVDHYYYLCLVLVMLSGPFIDALWSPTGKGLISWLLFVVFYCFLSLSHVVSWLRCDTWLFRFLTFAIFLTLLGNPI